MTKIIHSWQQQKYTLIKTFKQKIEFSVWELLIDIALTLFYGTIFRFRLFNLLEFCTKLTMISRETEVKTTTEYLNKKNETI